MNKTHTVCECNHMSSYSLLVDKSKPNVSTLLYIRCFAYNHLFIRFIYPPTFSKLNAYVYGEVRVNK